MNILENQKHKGCFALAQLRAPKRRRGLFSFLHSFLAKCAPHSSKAFCSFFGDVNNNVIVALKFNKLSRAEDRDGSRRAAHVVAWKNAASHPV